jgi:Leucine-rich repeat (LRR) protein
MKSLRDQKSKRQSDRVTITPDLLLELTDCERLDQIKVLSLRNKGLNNAISEISICPNLQIAYLQGNRLTSLDLNFITSFSFLLKVDLSSNQIKMLPEPETWS